MRLRAVILAFVVVLSGCSLGPVRESPAAPEPRGITCSDDSVYADPLGPLNRAVYRFNARFDEAIFLPVSRGYEAVAPAPVRRGINNFFANLRELTNVLNHALQGHGRRSAHTLARFMWNTTIGVGGLWDPAGHLGLKRLPTSFGHTLARWGVSPGPYLVLPLLGPSNLRDASGMVVDAGTNYTADLGGIYSSEDALATGAVYAVDTRANVDFRYYASRSPFEYDMVRILYTQKRLIESGVAVPPPPPCE
jgi:phospholipid-binding lipoprotein MlaA